jgi:hypothetical protein
MTHEQNLAAALRDAFPSLDGISVVAKYPPPIVVHAPPESPTTLTPPEVAKQLRKSPDYIRDSIRRGFLKASNLGSESKPRYVVTPEAVAEFLKAMQPTPPTPRHRRAKKSSSEYRRYSN